MPAMTRLVRLWVCYSVGLAALARTSAAQVQDEPPAIAAVGEDLILSGGRILLQGTSQKQDPVDLLASILCPEPACGPAFPPLIATPPQCTVTVRYNSNNSNNSTTSNSKHRSIVV